LRAQAPAFICAQGESLNCLKMKIQGAERGLATGL
jgi:hypothetical protein